MAERSSWLVVGMFVLKKKVGQRQSHVAPVTTGATPMYMRAVLSNNVVMNLPSQVASSSEM